MEKPKCLLLNAWQITEVKLGSFKKILQERIPKGCFKSSPLTVLCKKYLIKKLTNSLEKEHLQATDSVVLTYCKSLPQVIKSFSFVATHIFSLRLKWSMSATNQKTNETNKCNKGITARLFSKLFLLVHKNQWFHFVLSYTIRKYL